MGVLAKYRSTFFLASGLHSASKKLQKIIIYNIDFRSTDYQSEMTQERLGEIGMRIGEFWRGWMRFNDEG